MKNRIVFVLLGCILVFALVSCDSNTDVPPIEPPITDVQTEKLPIPQETRPPREDLWSEGDKGTIPEYAQQPFVVIEGEKELCYKDLAPYMEYYTELELLKTGDNIIPADDYIELCKIKPDVNVYSKVDFEGKIIDLSLNEVDISRKRIRDKDKFREFLQYVPSGIKFVMCDCGFTNEQMAGLRYNYPNLEFAWRIYMGKWNLRTDDEAFSVMIYDYTHTRLRSKDIEVLKYCTNMKALDLGHQYISDLTTIGNMSELRVLILADNAITNVEPLAKLKNLEYLELFVNQIKDLSPLAECTNLVDLNFGWNYVSDFSSIYSLEKIERLWLPNNRLPINKRQEVLDNFPNAKVVFADKNSISSGWRTHERYFSMRGMFTNNKYDENFIKNK